MFIRAHFRTRVRFPPPPRLLVPSFRRGQADYKTHDSSRQTRHAGHRILFVHGVPAAASGCDPGRRENFRSATHSTGSCIDEAISRAVAAYPGADNIPSRWCTTADGCEGPLRSGLESKDSGPWTFRVRDRRRLIPRSRRRGLLVRLRATHVRGACSRGGA